MRVTSYLYKTAVYYKISLWGSPQRDINLSHSQKINAGRAVLANPAFV